MKNTRVRLVYDHSMIDELVNVSSWTVFDGQDMHIEFTDTHVKFIGSDINLEYLREQVRSLEAWAV